ncbi:B12-binding domain-containing radical SAM protein [Pectinatus haikarae]|uniref:B12-binding domain-containing radical SAM protein n=1 Tax=Pectinatus haikarae TaxID=349096 RepID=UPI0018C4B829|nr:B12-binding domain-containing radical SAM protein [Pectinatus haikarae]
MKLLLTAINAKYIHSSLSMRYLKSCCSDLPLNIELCEFTINNHLLDIADQIFDKRPDILGVECYIWNIELIKELLPLIKKLLPHVIIICGGPEISYGTKEMMEQLPAIDYVIRGEGEETLHELLCRLIAGKNTTDIPGLAQKTLNGIETSLPVVFADMDKLPFPYADEDIKTLDNRIIYYESSRGCPFSCKYCLSCATKGVRYRSLDKVLPELAFFVRHNVRQIKFVDRTFNADKKHFLPILEFISKQNCRTNFHFETAIDYIDDDVLILLRKMPPGRVQLEIGIQSTNPLTLQHVSRHNNWQKISTNIKSILSFGNIHVHTDLIIGLPYEDVTSLTKSFNDMYALHPDMLQVGFLKLLKGSAMEHLVDAHKYSFMDTAPYQVLANSYISAEEMRTLRIFVDVFELYYNSGRFPNSLNYLINGFSNDAFSFFSKFALFWYNKGLGKAAHSPKSLYAYLAGFVNSLPKVSIEILFELMKLDAICSDHGRFKADFLNWSEKEHSKEIETFWKNSAVVQKYIPGYEFISRRTIKNNYHIEHFSIDIPVFINQHSIKQSHCIVLFIYGEDRVKKISIDKGDLL